MGWMGGAFGQVKRLSIPSPHAQRFHQPKNRLCLQENLWLQKSKDILINLLDGIFYSAEDAILNLEILDPDQAPRIKSIQDSYLDVKATLSDHTTVIIEM